MKKEKERKKKKDKTGSSLLFISLTAECWRSFVVHSGNGKERLEEENDEIF